MAKTLSGFTRQIAPATQGIPRCFKVGEQLGLSHMPIFWGEGNFEGLETAGATLG